MKVIRAHLMERPHWHALARYAQDHPNVPILSAVEFVDGFVKEQVMADKPKAPHVVAQAVTLASGTLATLTGLHRYDEIERVQNDFVIFCQSHPHFEKWQDAWAVFKEQ